MGGGQKVFAQENQTSQSSAAVNAVQGSGGPSGSGAMGTSNLTGGRMAGDQNESGQPGSVLHEPDTYDPSGRRDPFAALIQNMKGDIGSKKSLPPLQRVGLTELNLIGVIWGGFGFTAMVQTPDGKGYSVRRGTLVGPNNGVVTSITKKGIVVTEKFTDIYGRQQEREYIKLLHTEEEFE